VNTYVTADTLAPSEKISTPPWNTSRSGIMVLCLSEFTATARSIKLIWILPIALQVRVSVCENAWFDIAYADPTLSQGLRGLLSKLRRMPRVECNIVGHLL
jgi:hypothetical protein